jgi:hypothetical protein
MLYIPRNTSKKYKRFGCINYQARCLPKDIKPMKNNTNRDHVTTIEQENIISESKMADSQSLAFGMKVKAKMLSINF